jgi:hypothetical protein
MTVIKRILKEMLVHNTSEKSARDPLWMLWFDGTELLDEIKEKATETQ